MWRTGCWVFETGMVYYVTGKWIWSTNQTMLLPQTSHVDYEELYRLDCLGHRDSTEHGHQQVVHAEFKEQLQRLDEGWYETGLLCWSNHPHLPSNEAVSLRRLTSLTRNLQRDVHIEYVTVIQGQFPEGLVEQAHKPTIKEFYIPRKAVVKVIRDDYVANCLWCFGKVRSGIRSLNECLYPRAPLQNKL